MSKTTETAPAPEQVEALPLDGVEPVAAPEPGDPGYDWAADYGTDNLYTHTFSDGTVVALRSFGSIFSKTWLYKIRHLRTDIDIELAALERGSSEAARQVLDGLDDDSDIDYIAELWAGWSQSGTVHGDGDEGLSTKN